MTRIYRFTTAWPRLVIGVTLGLTLFFASQLVDFRTGEPGLHLDPSVERLLPDGDENREYYQNIRRIFGNDEITLIALVAPDAFTREHLGAVVRMTRRIENLEGVHHVVSLATALDIRAVGGDLEIEPLLSSMPEDAEGLRAIRDRALDNPVYAGNLVSADGRATALLVYFLEDLEEEALAEVDAQIVAIAAEERGDAEVRVTGGPHIKVATGQVIVTDLSSIIPMAMGVLFLVALISFRSLRGVLLPMAGITIGMIWTLGFMAAISVSLNLVTAVVPPLVLTIGFAYVVHILTEYNQCVRDWHRNGAPEGGSDAAFGSLEHAGLPILLTALTTIAGFMAMTLSPIGAIREVGIFSSIGIVACVIPALTFVPAVLQLLPEPKRLRSGASSFDGLAERLGRFDVKHRIAIMIVTALVTVIATASIPLIRVNNGLISNFRSDSPIRLDFEAINRDLDGSNPLYVVLDTDVEEGFKEPVNLRSMYELQRWLEEQPEIGGTTSLVEYLMLINRGLHGNDPEYLRIPENRRLATQLLFFGGNDELESFVDPRYQKVSILVRSGVMDSGALSQLIDRIEARLAELPPHLTGNVTGNTVIVAKTIDDIALGQAVSIGAAFVLIYLILTALFTSFRMGVIALIPNAIPVLVYFGAIGLSGTELNSTNGLVACIVLGIAVDDTIHYLTRFTREAHRLADAREGAIAALKVVGRPVTYTSIALALGFLTLTTADMKNWVEFGALGSFTIMVAWLVDITFVPALASGLKIVTLWDMVSLDLGSEPERSIPIFHGMTPRQARIAALTAHIESYRKGSLLFRAGEEGDVMFIVIEGELVATLGKGDKRIELSRMRRGDAVGEVGLFGGKRTADVTVVEDVRLMRLTEQDIDRIQRRAPRIAATLLRNLQRLMAMRMERTALAAMRQTAEDSKP